MAFNQVNRNFPTRRVVITGMGVVAPNGCELPVFWDSIIRGESAAAPITRFDAREMSTRINCEVKGFNPKAFMDAKKAHRLEICIQFGIAAAMMAAQDAKLEIKEIDPDRIAFIEGTSLSGMESARKAFSAFLSKGYSGMSPFVLINAYCGGGSGEAAMELGIRGHAISMSTGSASGNDTIGYGFRTIRDGEVDIAIAGGAEAPMIAPLFGGFCQARVMTTRNDAPQTSMRPLDKHRDGFLLGEGAGYVVLEELTHALARGAKIYAEVGGHGRSCEAYHSVAPHPDGMGMIRAMEKSLFTAQMHPSEIDYINIHGTATSSNDIVEMKAIRKLFGAHSTRVAVSSTKPITGHLLAAAGAVETVVCALSIEHGMIPHTANLSEPEEGCEGDLVMGHARPYPVKAVMNLSCGFGGKNACLILKEYRP